MHGNSEVLVGVKGISETYEFMMKQDFLVYIYLPSPFPFHACFRPRKLPQVVAWPKKIA